MLTADLKQFLSAVESAPPVFPGTTMAAAMLVIDENFTVCPDTGADNRYLDAHATADPVRALQQQQALATAIRRCGVPTLCFPSLAGAPDGVFPNNAFATTPGRLIIGSMRYPVRKKETARSDIRGFFRDRMGYQLIDLSAGDLVAELTGVLVVDRARQIGFCGMSERVDAAGARAMHKAFGLKATLCFDLAAGEYHSNVVLAVLAGRACVAHRDSLSPDAAQALERTYGEACLWISDEEKNAFVANCIAVTKRDVFMSGTALTALEEDSVDFFKRHGFRLQEVVIDELEKAGGSLRCLIAEVF